MGDGKNDGKRKKPENCRWENRRKTRKSRKQQMGKTMRKSQSTKKKDWTKTVEQLKAFCSEINFVV